MLEYVRRLLLAQTRLAAQFDTAPQPEIREVTLQMEKKEQNSPEEDAPGQEKRPGLMQTGAEMDGTETWSAEQALREMARQTLRLGEPCSCKNRRRRSWSRRERWRRR